MNNKTWYIYADSRCNDNENTGVVQYIGSKAEAERLLKKILKVRPCTEPPFKCAYVDWNWRSDIKQGRTVKELHGKNIVKVDSILDYLSA